MRTIVNYFSVFGDGLTFRELKKFSGMLRTLYIWIWDVISLHIYV